MRAVWKPCRLAGKLNAPPSKSMAHRYLIGAALTGEACELSGVDCSEDIAASIDCLRALGAAIDVQGDAVRVHADRERFLHTDDPVLYCRESGSTLRFLIPLALCMGKPVTFHGSTRLMERPLAVYEALCRERGFRFAKDTDSLTVCGRLTGGRYTVRGDSSSQFLTGLIFALVWLGEEAEIVIVPPFASRSYVHLTIAALHDFGAAVSFADEYTIRIGSTRLHAYSGKIEGDYSNAAFLDGFNCLGSHVEIGNLRADSLQGDRVYGSYFRALSAGTPTLDISDCPDLGPILIALAALQNGATFTGTDRLRSKESDRGAAMCEELCKLGGGLTIGADCITVPKQTLCYHGTPLSGHNDHRIVMACTVLLSRTGGEMDGIEAVRKSYPRFFEDIQKLGAEVTLYDR